MFRKRVLRRGSGIGHHEQQADEIYYDNLVVIISYPQEPAAR